MQGNQPLRQLCFIARFEESDRTLVEDRLQGGRTRGDDRPADGDILEELIGQQPGRQHRHCSDIGGREEIRDRLDRPPAQERHAVRDPELFGQPLERCPVLPLPDDPYFRLRNTSPHSRQRSNQRIDPVAGKQAAVGDDPKSLG